MSSPKTVFIDTGAFYAKYVASDQYHAKAVSLWSHLAQKSAGCITSNFVLSELITLMAYRVGSGAAHTVGQEIYASRFIKIVRIGETEEHDALAWIKKLADQKISMTDATSFALMKKLKIKTTFTFDKHFQMAGFMPFETT